MLSYEDTILTRTYKKHSRVSNDIDDSDLSEDEESSSDVEMMISEEASNQQDNSGDDISKGNNDMNDKFFEDIDVDLLYKSIKSTQSNEENEIDKILDENVEIFRKVQSMQEKRLSRSNPNIISAKEKEYGMNICLFIIFHIYIF